MTRAEGLPTKVAKDGRRAGSTITETLISGGVAGMIAKTAIAPFDRVKIHFQVHNPALFAYSGRMGGLFEALSMIYRKTGISGLYRGHSAMLMRVFPYAAINFSSYESFRSLLYRGENAENVAWWRRVLAGSLAGSVAVTLTYPLDIIRVRLAYDLECRPSTQPMRPPAGQGPLSRGLSMLSSLMSAYTGAMGRTICDLAKEGRSSRGISILGFYQGYLPTVAGIIPYAGVSFFAFETQKTLYVKHISRPNAKMESNAWHIEGPANTSVKNHPPRPDPRARNESIPIYAKLPMGMISGAAAQTVAYPLDVVRRRAQVFRIAPHLRQSHMRADKLPSPWSILVAVIRESGIRGLFTGISINYLKVAPATGISFVVYEFMKERVFHHP